MRTPREGRLGLAKCRTLLADKSLSDAEVSGHLDALYSLAEVACDAFSERAGCFDALRNLAPDEDWEAVEERAALREYEGGQSRDEAERAAVCEVLGYAEEARK